MNRRLAAALCPLLILAVAAAAGDASPVARLTLADCERLALEGGAEAVNAARDERIAAELERQVLAEALPTVATFANYTRLDEVETVELGEDSFKAGTLDNYSAGARATQILYSGGRVRAALRAARVGRNLAVAARREAESAAILDVRLAFHDLLLARATVSVREESVAQFEAMAGQVEARRQQGDASEYEVLSARVRAGNEKPALIQAINARELGMEAMRRRLALGPGEFDIAGELCDPELDVSQAHLERLACTNRPSLLRAEAEAALLEQDMRAARSGLLPRVDATATYQGGNSYGFAGFTDEWEWHWTAGVKLEWNLWDGRLTVARIASRRLEWEKSLTRLDDARRAARLETRQAWLDLLAARETLAACRGNEELAQKALSIAGTRVRSGVGTQLEFADANLALNVARLARLQALRDRMNAEARLKHACGTDDLAMPKPGAAGTEAGPREDGQPARKEGTSS